jgi:hypothetical protein
MYITLKKLSLKCMTGKNSLQSLYRNLKRPSIGMVTTTGSTALLSVSRKPDFASFISMAYERDLDFEKISNLSTCNFSRSFEISTSIKLKLI